MPPLTPSRKRLSLCEKQKIIEDSKKPGFDKNKTCEKYGIGKSTLNKIMLTQKDILGFIDKGTLSKNKSVHKSSQIYSNLVNYRNFRLVQLLFWMKYTYPLLSNKNIEYLLFSFFS